MQGEAQALVFLKANKLKLQSVKYVANRPRDILVRTIASTITPGLDRLLLTNKPVSHKVLAYPVMPGSETIGQVMQVGPEVTSVKEGDFVYAFKGDCWVGIDPYYGCHAEVIPTSEENVLALGRKPIHRDLLTGLVGYVLSAMEKVALDPSMRVLLLGLGSVGLMVSEYLHYRGIRHVDALENFPLRGQLSHAENIGIEIVDFTDDFNDRYDLVIETTGRILMVEKVMRLLKPKAKVLLMGSYEVLGYDYRLIQHKEPVIVCSSVTDKQHLIEAKALLETEAFETEKFFTNVFPVSQYELAYRIALDSKEAIKTVISWI
ncbi:MAG TPA: alcohol dehydrogenase [Chlorobaculum sp.]|jgi:2-desacetyl-2-hydroxyethyl bacteriochlorophyllide A dehydrogenase|uniref:Chlorobiumquinone synthase BchC related protein n=1 Tax=Chlorobaculum tepidum (strain ATCC 49652 / DSM 12025 / NBRC 103806 / TLS) TaxID=194439 RepID=Q8KD57_CHLTE|nr:zinc-binding alcohol dehydrogenase [Chlorobaculum tepidum]AAM72430.1 chlorobiumquinone synthase BchC related protein [Chlorobaculum tepidum TLS]HBU23930.1 alcohol dehydrogenase [Chlorobaculum sp.]